MDIVIEVTDGGSSDIRNAQKAVDALLEAHVITRSLQIGEVSAKETNDFNAVWNDHRPEPLGIPIGKDIVNLLPAVVQLLKNFLQHVRL